MKDTALALRMIVVIRGDLPQMTRAKGEVQFGHAIAALMHKAPADLIDRYMADNQPKICMEVDDLSEIERIRAKAESRGVTFEVIKDAAHTVFDEPTITCVGIGPMTKTDGNAITRGARMRA